MRKVFPDKQPYEEYHIDCSFAGDLLTETVSSYTVEVETISGTTATSTLTDATKNSSSGQSVLVWVQGGTDGTTYKYTIKVVGSGGSKYEGDATMKVEDL